MTELQEIFSLMLETADFEFQVDLSKPEIPYGNYRLRTRKESLLKSLIKTNYYITTILRLKMPMYGILISDTDYAFNKKFLRRAW